MKQILNSLTLCAMILVSVPTLASADVYENDLPNGYGGGGDPVSCELTATPDLIAVGGGTTLSWVVSSNVVNAYLTPKNSTSWMQNVPLDGSWYISGILDTRQYTLHVEGAEGQTASCDALITVDVPETTPPSCEIFANPGTIGANGATTLEWTSSANVVSAKLHPKGSMSWSQSVPVNGSWYISGIVDSRTYSLTVMNSSGEEYTCDAPIVVENGNGGGNGGDNGNGGEEPVDPGLAPTCELEAVPSEIGPGGATTLVWTGAGDNLKEAKLHPTGSTSFFATVTPSGSWYISGIVDSRSYSVTIFTTDGQQVTCDAPIAVISEEVFDEASFEIEVDNEPINTEDIEVELIF